MAPLEQLTYSADVSRIGDFHAPWWRVTNTGCPAQVDAAVRELAARIDRELDPYPHGWCWHLLEIRHYDGVLIEHFTGPVRASEITRQLRGTASRAGRIAMLDISNRRRSSARQTTDNPPSHPLP